MLHAEPPMLHAEFSCISHAKEFLLYFTWPLPVTLLRVHLNLYGYQSHNNSTALFIMFIMTLAFFVPDFETDLEDEDFLSQLTYDELKLVARVLLEDRK